MHMNLRATRERIFASLEQSVRRTTLRHIAELRPHGMVTGEELRELDEECEGDKRLWIASDLAVYVIDPPQAARPKKGFRLRVPYPDIVRYSESRLPDGSLSRTLEVATAQERYEASGRFKRPWQGLSDAIRAHGPDAPSGDHDSDA